MKGASSGIGVETARALAHTGATVILAVRNVGGAKSVVDDIKKTSGNDKVRGACAVLRCSVANAKQVEAYELDLADLQSVVAFANKFNERKLPLNILVANAGIMGVPFTKTKQGFESHIGSQLVSLQFFTCMPLAGVNWLGHMLLSILLLPAMQAGYRATRRYSRLVRLPCLAKILTYLPGCGCIQRAPLQRHSLG